MNTTSATTDDIGEPEWTRDSRQPSRTETNPAPTPRGVSTTASIEVTKSRSRNDNPREIPAGQRQRVTCHPPIDRIFSLLERAVGSDTLDGQQFDRLLSELERAITGPSEPNPETLAELVEILDELVAHSADVEVDAVLSVLEEAISGTRPIDGAHLEGVFDVIRKGEDDPAGIDP